MLSFSSSTYVISARRAHPLRGLYVEMYGHSVLKTQSHTRIRYLCCEKGRRPSPPFHMSPPPTTTTLWESIKDHRIQGWRLQRQHRLKLKWIHVLLMFLRFFQLTWLDVGELSWNWLPTNHTQVKKEKENFVVTSWSPPWNVTSCSNGREVYKKLWCTCEVAVLLI